MGAGLEAWIHRTDRGARGVLDQAGVEHVGEHQVDLQVPHCLEEATRPAGRRGPKNAREREQSTQ